MKKSILFAIDPNTQETIVSETEKGSNKVTFRERIARDENQLLFDSVLVLTNITRSPSFDLAIFKAMDKVCQLIYEKKQMEV
jgi:hypothetical protein